MAYGSSHRYRFPALVIAPSAVAYFTTDARFSDAVATNIHDTAQYRAMDQIVAAARCAGGIANSLT